MDVTGQSCNVDARRDGEAVLVITTKCQHCKKEHSYEMAVLIEKGITA